MQFTQGIVAQACKSSTWEGGVGGYLCVQGQPCLLSKFQDSQDYREMLSQKKKNEIYSVNIPVENFMEMKDLLCASLAFLFEK